MTQPCILCGNTEENHKCQFKGVSSSELFQALGAPKAKAETMERELHAIIRRDDFKAVPPTKEE